MRDRRSLNRALARLAIGDRAAFDEVFREVTPPAHALARRLLAGAADSDDAVQEAVLKIFGRAHQYDPSRDALTWALAIVAWECQTIRRRAQRSRLRDGALDAIADGARSPEDEAMDRELRASLGALVDELSPNDRATIVAAWHGERPPGVAPAAVRKRLERALVRLRGAWRTRHGT